MHPYIELNAHHAGNSHALNGMPCEDYSASYSDEQVSIVVVSDGHGDKNCFRSGKGAKYACEIAIGLCRRFQNITNHIDDIAQCDFESLVVSLESDIADAWKDKVLADANAHPFSDEELLSATEQAREVYKSGQRLEKAYGCTLIFSMSTASYWLSSQIGDGKSIAAYKDGVFVEPVPADENCLGNRSTSLCSSGAKEAFRHYYSKVKPIAAFVSSDGVEESFDQAGLYNFFFSVAYWLQTEGFDGAKAKIESLLPQISEGGSGDDVSAAIMVSTADAISKPRQTLDQIYERVNACKNVLNQCDSLLSDVNARISENSKECSAMEKEIEKLKAALAEKEKAYAQAQAEQETLLHSVAELNAKKQKTAEQMEKAKRFKASAERFWFAEFEKLALKRPLPVEEAEANVVLAEKTGEISEETEDAASPAADDCETVGIGTLETEAEISPFKRETDAEPLFPVDTIPLLKPVDPLAQEQRPEIAKEKPARHFWSFGKYPRK